MKPLPEMQTAPEIIDARKALSEAKENLDHTMAAAQAVCDHRFVFERPYLRGEFGKLDNARRVCRHCLLQEEGSHWSGGNVWSRADYTTPQLANVDGRIVTEITNDAFHRHLRGGVTA